MDWIGLVAGALAGRCSALVVFGGLWWTVRRMVDARRPALLMAVSLVARLAVAAVVFVIAARSGVEALVGVLVGVVAVRILLARSIRSDAAARSRGGPAVGCTDTGGAMTWATPTSPPTRPCCGTADSSTSTSRW